MERLDQVHLHLSIKHPETEMSRPGIPALNLWSTAPHASALPKSYCNSLRSLVQYENMNHSTAPLFFKCHVYILKMSNYLKPELFGLVCPLFLWCWCSRHSWLDRRTGWTCGLGGCHDTWGAPYRALCSRHSRTALPAAYDSSTPN
jgi:hypothetical protein